MTTLFYGSVSGFRSYHSQRGRDTSIYNDTVISAALIVASESLDTRYRRSYPGLKPIDRTQVRDWPRLGAIDIYSQVIPNTEIPWQIENATYELTLIECQLPRSLSVNYVPNKYDSVSISGAISVKYTNVTDLSDVQTRYAIVDEILSTIICAEDSKYSGAVCR